MNGPDDLTRRQFLEATAVSVAVATALAGSAAAEPRTTTAARYVVERLRGAGVEALFGVPGATCDPLYAAAEREGLPIVVTSSDLEAGYAADGYARFRGLAAVAVTYGVGTLALAPVIAGAYAERSPIVVVNGGPSAEDLRVQDDLGSLFSHSMGARDGDLAVFRTLTAFAARPESAAAIPRAVDEAVRTAIVESRPVYLEIPKHLWTATVEAPASLVATRAPTGTEAERAAELLRRLAAAARPALLLGVEVQRHGLEDAVAALVGRLGLPWATTLLAKSVIPESTPGFVGVYAGSRSLARPREAIEGADVVLALGCVFGRQYRSLVSGSGTLLLAAGGRVRIGREEGPTATLGALVEELARGPWARAPSAVAPFGRTFAERRAAVASRAHTGEHGLGYDDVLAAVSDSLDEGDVVLPDTSLAMYPAADLAVVGRKAFACNGVWQSIGWSVAAAVGVGVAGPRRPVVLCGDGGFQMTAQALSTMARHRVRALVVVLDNGVYAIEQWLLDPSYFARPTSRAKPYLALQRWRYAALAEALGAVASVVDTPAGLRDALAAAKGAAGPVLVHAIVRPHDLPSGL